MSNTIVSTRGVDQSLGQENPETINQFPWHIAFVVALVASVAIGIYRWYQQTYSFTVGLDYFEPEFEIYWMRLFYTQLTVIILGGGALNAYLWFTRPETVNISPEEELRIYKIILAVLLGIGIVAPHAFMLFMEADAAWHQVTIRDTDFTPTHIGLFYFFLPLMVAAIFSAFVWVHTRLPDFRDRVSLPMAMILVGPILIMPNVGFNEWGHTFFYAEELFAAPIHWGFVGLGWAFFGITGFMVQILARMVKLTSFSHKVDAVGE